MNSAIWKVFDKNAHMRVDGKVVGRIHTAAAGFDYTLFASEGTPMPEEHARVFLRDPAFVVQNEDGDVVASLEAEQMSRKPPEELRPGYVVATVDELSDDALLTRASVLPNGANMTSDTPREMLIDFIVASHTPRRPNASDDGELGGSDTEAMDRRTLDRLLPKPASLEGA